MSPKVSPILVTGAHRTGTTWVGRMLAADPRLAYISEPLNVLHRPGVLRAEVPHWYTYICEENETNYLPSFLELLSHRYHLWSEIKALHSGKDFLRMGRDFGIFLRGRLSRQRVLLKDPFAVFSSPWFVKRLNCQVVVTIRHPAGFASSLKRLNWPFDFSHLLDQPLLMRDHLEPYRREMQSMAAEDVIGQAGLLWTMVYRFVHATLRPSLRSQGDTRGRTSSVRVVRHEDLAFDPAAGYRHLYGELGLNFTPRVEQVILRSSSSENPAELSLRKVHSVKLDSRAGLDSWKRRLSSQEIARVRRLTEEVAHLYYPEVDWN